MSDTSPTLSLPYIQPAQAQKHVTHNEAVELLDLIVQLRLEAVDLDTPPGAPADGAAWAIGDAPTGDWIGQSGQIATFRGNGWLFVTPLAGWQAWDIATGAARIFDGSTWVIQAGAASFENLPGVGVNATSDAGNRLSVSSPATLLNHEGAGHQVKINKSSTGDTASLLYQSGFSGRAEMGLAGSDDFTIKASADGSAWFTGLTVKGATGAVQIEMLLQLAPAATPVSPTAGDVYFDSTANKLRCYDGTVWQDLF